MSEHLQSGYHPDADQISAFVEHALPAHEREQMLDHLAACEECRAVVEMSLPEVEEPEPARSLHTAARKSWWSNWTGWTVTWSLAGALAAVVLSVVIIRHAGIASNILAPNQIAVSHPPEPLAPKGESPKSQSPIPSSTTNKRAAADQPADSGGASLPGQARAERQQNAGTAGKTSSFTSLSIQGRNLGPLDQKVPESAANPGLGVVSGLVAAPQGSPEARAQNPAPAKPVMAAALAPQPASAAPATPPISQAKRSQYQATPPALRLKPTLQLAPTCP